jgi:hypothetical protein
MSFNTNKWMKNQYLNEAGLQESLAQQINQVLPENLGYKEFAKAVAEILKDEYGSHNFSPFMDVLHAELGINESINEGTYDVEGITPENLDKVDISFVEGRTTLYAVYIYLKGRERKYQWDKKLGSKEFQKVLDMLGIDIDFQDDPYKSSGMVLNALEDKGYDATTSDFDVS